MKEPSQEKQSAGSPTSGWEVNPIDRFLKTAMNSFSKLSDGEKWAMAVQIAQTVILLFTFIMATLIGIRQNEINQALYRLQTRPSIGISHNLGGGGIIQVNNKGAYDIMFKGLKIGNQSHMESELRLVGVGETFDVHVGELEQILEANQSTTAEVFFLDGSEENQYTARVRLKMNVEAADVLSIRGNRGCE